MTTQQLNQAFDSFKAKWLGKRVDADGVYKYQCVDLIRQFLHEATGYPTKGAWGNAIDYWYRTSPALAGLRKIAGSGDIKKGDIVVLETNVHPIVRGKQPGHLTLATGNVSATQYEALEQNGHNGAGDGVGGNAIRTRWIDKARVAGVLRLPTSDHPYAYLVGRTIKLEPKNGTWTFYDPGSTRKRGVVRDEGDLVYLVRGVDKDKPNRVLVNSASLGNGSSVPLADAAMHEYKGEWRVL